MSHTPGPWYAHDFSGLNSNGKKDPSDVCVSCVTPDHLTVCYMGNGLTATHKEWEANAHLIAAAPELLEALEELLGWECLAPIEAYENARDAIAKARGQG